MAARAPCCEKMGVKKGPWSPEEDEILISFIEKYGHANWRALPKQAGLLRCGKSCRLRWFNYLRPDIKRGNVTKQEEETILKLHQLLGNRWSAIASRLPGRTDNEIKNFWHSHLKKRLKPQIPAAATTTTTIKHLNRDQIIQCHRSQYAAILAPQEASIAASRTISPLDRDHQKLLSKLSTFPAGTNCANNKVDQGGFKLPHFCSNSAIPIIKHAGSNSKTKEEDMDFWYNLFVKAGEPSRD